MNFLPESDREYLSSKGISFEEAVCGGNKGIILKGRPLPDGRFDASAADILIMLPAGYPDVKGDVQPFLGRVS